MPNVRQNDGRLREVAYATDHETLQIIQNAVIAEYEKITSQEPEASDEQAIYLVAHVHGVSAISALCYMSLAQYTAARYQGTLVPHP